MPPAINTVFVHKGYILVIIANGCVNCKSFAQKLQFFLSFFGKGLIFGKSESFVNFSCGAWKGVAPDAQM